MGVVKRGGVRFDQLAVFRAVRCSTRSAVIQNEKIGFEATWPGLVAAAVITSYK